jgi:hypothetical protein
MRPGVAKLRDTLVESLQSHPGLTYEQLRSWHQPAYLSAHGLDVKRAEHYAGFVSSFRLRAAQHTMLADLGFAVIPRPAANRSPAGPVDLYYRVFAAHLPVFITADSILHAWHRSYENLVEAVERLRLQTELRLALERSIEALNAQTPAGRDALLYLGVARALLDPDWAPPDPVAEDCAQLVAAAHAGAIRRVHLFGDKNTVIDFSQFIPRGHYSRWEDQQRYFRAMMWLGRVDLVLFDAHRRGPPNPRTEAAARALVAAVRKGGAEEPLNMLDDFYRAQVGRTNAISPLALLKLCAEHGLKDCAGSAQDLQQVYEAWGVAAYSGRYLAKDRYTVSLRCFPQRFAIDAWVTSNTTTPELAPPHPAGRAMASVLDVAFALGSNRALEYFRSEMALPQRENLPAMLYALRTAIRAHRPTTVDDSVYNHWLEALVALSTPTVDERYPKVMRTGRWHDRKLEAVLGSWAELRHDTVLTVEQSMGSLGCQYPQGYVEPVPGLYRALGRAAAKLRPFYAAPRQLPPAHPRVVIAARARAFLVKFQQTMKRLAKLAELQLAGGTMSGADLAFLRHTVDRHAQGYGGIRSYDGWYPALFWTEAWQGREHDMAVLPYVEGGILKPVVTDVHTDTYAGSVLQVGVGSPELLIAAIDTQQGVALYGGPVYSVYAFARPISQRMTDNEWGQLVGHGRLPGRPAFARRYRAQPIAE